MSTKLTARQLDFVAEYLIDLNATAAYRRAFQKCGYRAARVEASRLLASPNIQREIAAVRRAQMKRTRVTADNVVKELARVAHSDIGNCFDLSADEWKLLPPRRIPFAARKAIRAFEVTRTADGTETIRVVLYDKVAALDKLARHLGLYQPLPPLVVLLAALPPQVAETVKAALGSVGSERPA